MVEILDAVHGWELEPPVYGSDTIAVQPASDITAVKVVHNGNDAIACEVSELVQILEDGEAVFDNASFEGVMNDGTMELTSYGGATLTIENPSEMVNTLQQYDENNGHC